MSRKQPEPERKAPGSPVESKQPVLASTSSIDPDFLSRMAAGFGLYWGTTTAVSLVQAALLRRGNPT